MQAKPQHDNTGCEFIHVGFVIRRWVSGPRCNATPHVFIIYANVLECEPTLSTLVRVDYSWTWFKYSHISWEGDRFNVAYQWDNVIHRSRYFEVVYGILAVVMEVAVTVFSWDYRAAFYTIGISFSEYLIYRSISPLKQRSRLAPCG